MQNRTHSRNTAALNTAPPAQNAPAPLPRHTHDPKHPAGVDHLFLREEQMRHAQDLLFFAYRDFTAAADIILEELGLGRAHHRAIHFIGRQPGITVGDLLAILRITKQSLARVLTTLVDGGLVHSAPGRNDRRQRLLALTDPGRALERRLFESQRERLAAAYRDAGGPAVDGFRRVMRAIMEPPARAALDKAAPPLGTVSPNALP